MVNDGLIQDLEWQPLHLKVGQCRRAIDNPEPPHGPGQGRTFLEALFFFGPFPFLIPPVSCLQVLPEKYSINHICLDPSLRPCV